MTTVRRSVKLIAVASAVLAAAVRCLYFADFAESSLANPGAGGHDRALYHRAAQEPFFPDRAFDHMPLYPWALRLIYLATGPRAENAAYFGIACDAATAALIALTAARLGAIPPVAALASLLYAMYPLAIAYSVQTMPNTLNAFATALFAWISLRFKRQRTASWLGLGLLAGTSALGWAAWLLMAPAWALAEALSARERSIPLRHLLAFALAFAGPIAVVAVHNARIEGQFVGLTTHSGFNFYMGNHERATGHPVRVRNFRMTAGALLEDAHRAAEEAVGRKLSRAESSAWWSEQAMKFWRERPADALRLALRKAVLVFHGVDVDDLRLVELSQLLVGWFESRWWPSFAWIGWAGLVGLACARGAGPLRSLAAAGVLSLVAMFITARYRLALAPLFLGLGAAGLRRITDDFRAGRPRLSIVLALAALGIVFWPFQIPDQRPTDYANAAVHLMQANRAEEALRMTDRGLAIRPNFAPLLHARGEALFRLGAYREAAASFAAVLEVEPTHPLAAYNFALSLARAGDVRAARDTLRAAAARRPLSESAAKLLADLEASLSAAE